MMKRLFFLELMGVILLIFAYLFWGRNQGEVFLNPLIWAGGGTRAEKTAGKGDLAGYSFPNLAKKKFESEGIRVGNLISEEEKFNAYFFFYGTEGKQVSGQLNVPKGEGPWPVVIMYRGYVDKEIYFTGLGTHRVAAKLAEAGFVTLAPDFLGFGASDPESNDILLNRFGRPVTFLSLLAALPDLNSALEEKGVVGRVVPEKLFFWAHSNGGQIALSVLEITGRRIPTTLWAPVTKAFPESVLQYASDQDEDGRLVIGKISAFCEEYEETDYSIASFWERIKAPLQFHQGTGDPYVASADTEKTVAILREEGKEVTLYLYPRDDHNLKENWDQVVARDLEFFGSKL